MPITALNDPSGLGVTELLGGMTPVGGTAAVPRSRLPWWLGGSAGSPATTGTLPEDLLKDLHDKFHLSGSEVTAFDLGGAEAQFDAALKAKARGLPLDDVAKGRLTTAHTNQLKVIGELEEKIATAESAMFSRLHEPLAEIRAHATTVQKELKELAKISAAGTDLRAVTTLTQKGSIFTIPALPTSSATADVLFNITDHAGSTKNIIIGKMDAAGKLTLAATEVKQAEQALAAWHSAALKAPTQLLDETTKQFGMMRDKLATYKTQATTIGAEVLGIAEKAAPALVAEGAKDVEKIIAGAAKNAEGALIKNAAGEYISEGAAKLGVLGEEAMGKGEKALGWFGKLKANMGANLGIEGALTKNSAGQIEAKAAGTLNKGIKIASTAAGAVLVGYGLKDLGKVVGFVGPDTDEQGKEIPADSGTLIKSIAEVGAGAALAYFSLLKGGRAAGMVK